MKKNRLIWFISLLFFSVQLFAQNITVSGRITDSSNSETLIGVSVIVKGSTQGSISDLDGNYTLNAPENATLVFSYLGYTTQEVAVKKRRSINVSMNNDQELLDEVVVVGTVMRKSDLTGAVGSVSQKVLEEKPVTNINQALQGRVAGVMISNAAKPGDDSDIKIRGINTINGKTDPVYVVDGLIMDNYGGGFNSINLNDVASIEVMKDASSTALYGSRAANGVIVITTKKGKKGQGKVSYDAWFGVRTTANIPKTMNSKQLFELRQDAATNAYKATHPNATEADLKNFLNTRVLTAYDPGTPGVTEPSGGFVFGQYELDAYANPNFKDYDWLDEVTRDGIEQNHALSFSGGSDTGSYFLSFGYSDQKGMVKKLSDKKYSGRINADQNIKPWLKVGTSTSFVHSESQIFDNDGVYEKARGANPMLAISQAIPTLNYGAFYDENYFNPLNTLKIDNDRTRNRIISTNFININPIKGVNFRTAFSLNHLEGTRFRYIPNNIREAERYHHNGQTYRTREQQTRWQWDNSLAYDNVFNGLHRVNGMIGTEMSRRRFNSDEATGSGFSDNLNTYYNIGSSNLLDSRGIGSNFLGSSLLSYIARANYTYNNKYFLTATARYDGSSKFADGNQWGLFPSFSVAWDMVQEDFMKELNFIDQLKPRVGYGKVGNQEIDDYSFLTLYTLQPIKIGESGYTRPGQAGNKDIKWEAQSQLNIGFDAGFLNNRIRFSADYFRITNTDLLMNRTLWGSSGHTNRIENVGEIKNQGFEFTIDGKIINTSDMQWNLSGNISTAKNEVVKLTGGVDYILKYDDDRNLQKTENLFVGKPSHNTIYIWKTGGIAQEEDMERLKGMNWAGKSVNPGDLYPLDISGPDGTPDGKMDDYDRVLIDGNPDFYGGFATDFTYKGISLNAGFTYSYGGKKLSPLYETMIGSSGKGLASVDLLDRWSPENTGAKFPRPYMNDPASNAGSYNAFSASSMDHSVQNASYLRLSTLTLAYTLPRTLIKKIGISDLRLYTTASNLFCITPYKGYDPEMGDWYPPTRMFVFGMNLAF